MEMEQPVIRGSALGALNGEAKWVSAIEELMNAVDEYIPTPTRDSDKTFLMPVKTYLQLQDVELLLQDVCWTWNVIKVNEGKLLD